MAKPVVSRLPRPWLRSLRRLPLAVRIRFKNTGVMRRSGAKGKARREGAAPAGRTAAPCGIGGHIDGTQCSHTCTRYSRAD